MHSSETELAKPIVCPAEFDWTQESRMAKVLFAGAEALKALGAISKETAKKGDEVVRKAFELFPSLVSIRSQYQKIPSNNTCPRL
jgi:hypothetical protein